jgi:hypothetical protein
MLKQLQEIFGSMSKWILLAIGGIAVVLGIVMFVFIIENIKWVIITVVVLAVLGVGGYVLYKKFKKPATTPPVA